MLSPMHPSERQNAWHTQKKRCYDFRGRGWRKAIASLKTKDSKLPERRNKYLQRKRTQIRTLIITTNQRSDICRM